MLLGALYSFVLLFGSFLQITSALPSQIEPNWYLAPVLPKTNATLIGNGASSSPSHPSTPPQHGRDWPPNYRFEVGNHGCSMQVLHFGHRSRYSSHLDALWNLLDQAYDYVDDERNIKDHQGLLSRFYSKWNWPPPVNGLGMDPPPLMVLSLSVTESGRLMRADLRSVIGRLHREVQWSGKPAIEMIADVLVVGRMTGIIHVKFGKGHARYGSLANETKATA